MKFLISVAAALLAGNALAQGPGHCLQWKYRCTEKDEYGTCIAWETECIKWGGGSTEGPGKDYPGTGAGTFSLRSQPTDPANGLTPPFILESMSRGVESFELMHVAGKMVIKNIVRTAP
jgi:hypothetical protein